MTDQQDITQERCAICGKPKGQPPERCAGHYEQPWSDTSSLEEENKLLRAALEKIANVSYECHAAWGTSASIAMRKIAKQALEEKRS